MSVPDLIGRYRLGPRLGSGGFAVVWSAHDESLDTTIAIKVLADIWAHRMDLRERFLTEAKMLRKASSTRIVQVFDIGELPDGRPYFVMEYADRGTLADRTESGPLPLVEALRVTAEVARGAGELHRAGIVHRDLKPSNVLVSSTPEGPERLLIADLGVAKSLAQASGLTMSVGSAGYMAPEQAGPISKLDVRADVYSLGALGYHLITAEMPGAPGQVLPDRAGPDLPPAVRRVLARALEVDPARRWPDADTLATQLDALADELQNPPARSVSRRRALAALVVVAVLAAGAVTGLGVAERRKPIQVQDATHRITIDVPRSWSAQLQPGGWDSSALKLSGGRSPGLLVAADVEGWSDLHRNVNGVLVGLTDDSSLPSVVATVRHPECRPRPPLNYSDARWQGQVRRWDRCAGGRRSLEEISLRRAGPGDTFAYLQIRQDGALSATARILASLRVSG